MDEVRITADLWLDADRKKEVWPLLERLVAGSRAEAGNTAYELTEDVDDPEHLVFIERWKSPAAVEEHNQTPHFREFSEATSGAKGRVSILRQVL